MAKVSVYLNPRASRVSAVLWETEIRNQLFRRDVIFRRPANLVELKYFIQKDVEEKVSALISVGGDGTVHTLIQYLAGTDVALLVIPGGTANDLAHELGQMQQIQKCLWCILRGETEKIDLIKVNDRYMVTNGGLGITSLVAMRVNQLRQKYSLVKDVMRIVGKNIYGDILKLYLIFAKSHYQRLKIESISFNDVVETPIFMINNQPKIAGHFNVAPETKNNDGHFNVTILTHPKKIELLKCIRAISLGNYPKEDPHLISFETDNLRVTNLSSFGHLPFFGDGEVFEESSFFDVTVLKQGLRVYRQSKNRVSHKLQE